ncbi:MAG TPA: sulfite exporter TauE/SafE family protein [Moraxellaceae bacterium]|nr:sulfite exporter TauE/SafE family protein [Moraxellaceae bacterium]
MLAVLVGLLIGLVLGLTGAGGSVLAVPLVMRVLGQDAVTAAGLSLGAVALAATLGVLLRLGKGQIVWRAALLVGGAGALAVPAGQALARRLPEALLVAAFTVLVAVIAVRMWRQAARQPEATRVVRAARSPADAGIAAACTLSESGLLEWRWPCALRLGAVGLATGVLSGLFGVGGGFVIVPALVLLAGLPMVQAVATSLAIIMAVAATGVVAQAVAHPLPAVAAPVMAGGVGGMLLGTALAPRLAGPALQRLFVVAMLLLAGWNLWPALARVIP